MKGVLSMLRHGVDAKNKTNKGKKLWRTVTRSVATVVTALLIAGAAPALAHAAPAQSQNLWGLGVSNAAVSKDVLEKAMGRNFQAVGIYTQLSDSLYPNAMAKQAASDGATIYLNINSWTLVGNKKVPYMFSEYQKGTYDGYLQKWVDDLKAFGYDKTYLTFTHEPTVDSGAQPYCGTAAEYVKAYDYVYHYFRDHGVTYPWVWWMVASSF